MVFVRVHCHFADRAPLLRLQEAEEQLRTEQLERLSELSRAQQEQQAEVRRVYAAAARQNKALEQQRDACLKERERKSYDREQQLLQDIRLQKEAASAAEKERLHQKKLRANEHAATCAKLSNDRSSTERAELDRETKRHEREYQRQAERNKQILQSVSEHAQTEVNYLPN